MRERMRRNERDERKRDSVFYMSKSHLVGREIYHEPTKLFNPQTLVLTGAYTHV